MQIGAENRKILPGFCLDHIKVRKKPFTVTWLLRDLKDNEMYATLSILVHARI